MIFSHFDTAITSAPLASFKLGDLNSLNPTQNPLVPEHTNQEYYFCCICICIYFVYGRVDGCDIIISFSMGLFCMRMFVAKTMIRKAQCYPPGGVRRQRGGRPGRH